MLGSDILEVAIGMVFLFLFMSTLASAMREAIEAWMQHRAEYLERGITEMLRTGQGEQWVEAFYKHPLISSLYKGTYNDDALLPAYIPKQNFSMAIIDLAARASETGQVLTVDTLKRALQIDAPNEVQRVVLTALAAAGDDLDGIRKHLENWYDGTMDRVASWYTRRSAKILFWIGLWAAVLINVDTVTVTRSLFLDRPLRQAVVAQAEGYSRRNAKPTGTEGEKQPDANEAGDAVGQQKKSFDELRTEFTEIGFPVGWSWEGYWPYPAPQARGYDKAGFTCSKDGACWCKAMAAALVGWLITAIAIMLGAPFWFDLLNKLVSLRSSLRPPEEKPSRGKAEKPAALGDPVAAPAVPVHAG